MNRRPVQLVLTAAVATAGLSAVPAAAEDVSAPAILQFFEGSWNTLENRSVDAWRAGYGSVWVPPTGIAETGGFSVGYDVFDRFDLGSPDRRTLYGTEAGLKQSIDIWQRTGGAAYADLVWNHNGFADETTFGFEASGGYAGFTFEGGLGRGDFHNPAGGVNDGRLSGLLDIDHEQNLRFVRNPVPGFNNLPAGDPAQPFNGRVANLPSEDNRRFYASTSGPGRTLFDPRTNETFTVWDFQPGRDPMAGDPTEENATGYLMRNAQWLVQDVGFDGFRLDAVKHMEPWVLDYYDRSVYGASQRTLLDGSQRHVFSFGEALDGDKNLIQSYIRKDINPAQPNVVGGNRDALDFPLHFALKQNLSGNGFQNDFRDLVGAGLDVHDDGLVNGSQGVAFDASHDDGGAFLGNVANAYLLMRPGNANVYFNAGEFGDRDFPKAGRGDALGGLYGETITTLVGLRNTHGRGNYVNRLVEKESMIYERQGSALVVLSNRTDGGFDERTVQTSFAQGTLLKEMTGNAMSSGGAVPEVIEVGANGVANLRVRRNGNDGNGYLIYGLPTPEGELTLGGASGVLPGGTPTDATNGTTRLSDLAVVTGDQFTVNLQTQPVFLLGTLRDEAADGDNALLKINGGLDVNNNGFVDNVSPNSVAYGFEQFMDKSSPLATGGDGEFVQNVDTTNLPEGVNFVEVRAFRQRDDGGPAVFTSWREGIYVDRLPPETAMAAVRPIASAGSEFRQFQVQSVDQTADSVHTFLNLPANLSDAEILSFVSGGNRAGQLDRDLFAYGYDNVQSGNNVLTVVAFEPTGNRSVTRFAGLAVDGARGLGLGDVNGDGVVRANDVAGAGAFEEFLYSRDARFNPAADLDGDGRVTNLDLYDLPNLLDALAPAAADEARAAVVRRGNVNLFGGTDAFDIDHLRGNLGDDDWLFDLDVDGGVADEDDVITLIEVIFGTTFGDATLDGRVDLSDFGALRANFGDAGGWAEGDFNGDGVVNLADFGMLRQNFGFGGAAAAPGAVELGGTWYELPEPAAVAWLAGLGLLLGRRRAASPVQGN
jgi:hypothetical protein